MSSQWQNLHTIMLLLLKLVHTTIERWAHTDTIENTNTQTLTVQRIKIFQQEKNNRTCYLQYPVLYTYCASKDDFRYVPSVHILPHCGKTTSGFA